MIFIVVLALILVLSLYFFKEEYNLSDLKKFGSKSDQHLVETSSGSQTESDPQGILIVQ